MKRPEAPSKMEPKTGPMRPQNSGCPRSWLVLAAKTPQDPPRTAPRPPQDRPKTPQARPRPPPDTPRRPQDTPKTCPKPDKDAPRSRKTPKRPPKAAQDRPRGAQELPKSAQEASKGAQERDFQGTGGAFEAVPPFKAGQTSGADGRVRLAWLGRLERPSRPDLTWQA